MRPRRRSAPWSAFGMPRQDPGAQAPTKATEPFVRKGTGSPVRALGSASALLAGWWALLFPPRGFPPLGADQLGDESQTCSRFRQCWLRALTPPRGPSSGGPGGPAWASPPGQGGVRAATAQRGFRGAPDSAGPGAPGRAHRPPGQVRLCSQELPQGDGGRAPGPGLISLNYMDFVHSPTPTVASIVQVINLVTKASIWLD